MIIIIIKRAKYEWILKSKDERTDIKSNGNTHTLKHKEENILQTFTLIDIQFR